MHAKNFEARHGGSSHIMLVSIEDSGVLAGLSPTDFFVSFFQDYDNTYRFTEYILAVHTAIAQWLFTTVNTVAF